jgi:hypothetical protein
MITRYVIRIFSTYEFQTECGLLHLDRIYRGNSGGFHFNVRQILKLSGLFHLSRIYTVEWILGSIHSNNTTRNNKGSWQDCLLRPWVLTCDELKMKWEVPYRWQRKVGALLHLDGGRPTVPGESGSYMGGGGVGVEEGWRLKIVKKEAYFDSLVQKFMPTSVWCEKKLRRILWLRLIQPNYFCLLVPRRKS